MFPIVLVPLETRNLNLGRPMARAYAPLVLSGVLVGERDFSMARSLARVRKRMPIQTAPIAKVTTIPAPAMMTVELMYPYCSFEHFQPDRPTKPPRFRAWFSHGGACCNRARRRRQKSPAGQARRRVAALKQPHRIGDGLLANRE